MSPKLEISDLHKRFGALQAVHGVSLVLEQGEFFSLLGPSGCGKSTILAVIAGFFPPDHGDIIIDGRRVNDVSVGQRRIGLVLQDYAVFTSLTVRANLSFGLEARGVSRASRRHRVAAIARQFDLTALLNCRGATLNMSEMQRVALARALVTEPELLLLDEPMSNLDAATRARLRSELRHIQRSQGRTVLYVTHDQIEALSMSDRIAVMRDGRLLQVASPEEIYHRPVDRFVAEFIGDPPINIIGCDVRREAGNVVIFLPGLAPITFGRASIQPGPHFVAIRPHDVELCRGPQAGTAAAPLRLIENFGAEHVLHVEYAGDLVRIESPPLPSSIGDVVHLRFDPTRLHLIDRVSERVVPLGTLESAV